MNDKQDRYFYLTVILALLIYWVSKPKTVNNSTLVPTGNAGDSFINNPDLASYNPDTGFQPINVNIGNQAINYLNANYIPLFGFIGMAQGKSIH